MTKNEPLHDVAIIGGGPSGLSVACGLDMNTLKVDLYESGKSIQERIHTNELDIGAGIGGAGLFSDGKFSYFPSGSNLYKLNNIKDLKKAYEWVIKKCGLLGIKYHEFPDEGYSQTFTKLPTQKNYPSYYASLDKRIKLISELANFKYIAIFTEAKVEKVLKQDNHFLVISNINGKTVEKSYKAVVFANGKFSAHWLENICNFIKLKAIKYELGMRIEFDNKLSFLKDNTFADVKYIWGNENYKARTFCTCKQGEVWNVNYGNISSISGRADGVLTDYCNFGLLVKFDEENFKNGLIEWMQLKPIIESNIVIWQSLEEFLDNKISHNTEILKRPWFPKDVFQHDKISNWCSPSFYEILKNTTKELLSLHEDLLHHKTVCLFPAIEGTGAYPELDDTLKAQDCNIWFTGDSTGTIRGIIPSLVSGYYVSINILNRLQNELNRK